MKSIDWEGYWSCTSMALIAVCVFVQSLGVAPWFTHAVAVNAIACGATLAFIYFGEFGEGRAWYGGILPACAVWWGLTFI